MKAPLLHVIPFESCFSSSSFIQAVETDVNGSKTLDLLENCSFK